VNADIVSPIPNSGRWHAKGYSEESGILYDEVFFRYDYSDRSYTLGDQARREEEGETKQIPDEYSIKGKQIIIDSTIKKWQKNLIKKFKNLKKQVIK